MSAWVRASTSRARIFSAPLTASAATCSRSFWRADCTSCSIWAWAAATSRSPSVLACAFDSSTRWAAVFSAAATSSCARPRASRTITSVCFCASASEERPRSASASPSAICFWRVSIARISGGQIHLRVARMKVTNTATSANIVKFRFMKRSLSGGGRLDESRDQRVGEREKHREADADDERSVDQAEKQENLGLELGHELRLSRGAFEEAAAHDAHAHACAERAQADHEADADSGGGLDHGDPLKLVHSFSFRCTGVEVESLRGAQCPSWPIWM